MYNIFILKGSIMQQKVQFVFQVKRAPELADHHQLSSISMYFNFYFHATFSFLLRPVWIATSAKQPKRCTRCWCEHEIAPIGSKKRIPRPSISELPDDSASEGMHVSLSFVEAEVLEKLNIIVLVSQRIIVFHILSELPLDSMPNSGKSL
jgi:hypothetical protein